MPWIADNVYDVKSRTVSMFIFKADEGPICFDTGINKDAVKREFELLPFDPHQVTRVFLTHTDRDHVDSLNLFENARVYLSVDEEQMINRKTPRFFGFVHNHPINKPYQLLRDGDVVQAGETTIEAIATPGHTPGSMSYLVDNSVLFSGDTIALKEGKVRHFSKLNPRDKIHMDIATQVKSIKKLAKLKNVSLLATAHTGFTTDFEYAMSDWI
jgi:hydroxyacylglutathione hydrolase